MDTEYDLEDEVLEDVEPYEGAPDFEVSQTNDEDAQEDDADVPPGLGFLARATEAIRTWDETLAWYKNHMTEDEIGFNPDNMCLKICRIARNIPAKHLTALQSQHATPIEHRFYSVSELRRGMNVYYDDPRDSNRAGHIGTVFGRVKGFNRTSLHDVLVLTNSVQAGRLTIVRGDYFEQHWGDDFQFGADILNGVELDLPQRKSKVERFNNGGPVYNLNLLAKAGEFRPKPKAVLQRIEDQIRRLPDAPKLVRVANFLEQWRDTRKIDLSLLDKAVNEGRTGTVMKVRDQIRHLIDTLPEE